MTSIHKDKEDIKSYEFCKLLSQTGIQIIGSNLFTKLITQKRKEIKMKTKERKKFLINN